MHVICPHCHSPLDLVEPTGEILCPSCGSSFRIETGSTTGWRPQERRQLGRFELLEAVGTGAFGTVYRARDTELDRVVAIKVPRAGSLTEGQDRDRFLREARSVAQLRHAGIVPVYEVGTADGLPYLVSEFVPGVTLADLLTARRPAPREAAELLAAVADSLQYAHERGIVHRDVKPSNIMIGDGGPQLMDFGLAKRDAGEVTMTTDGQILGTPAYMAPEQARGEAHRVDGRSDVYSLGVVLYQLLTGELPFRGNSRMLLHQVLHDEPRAPRSLNDRVPRDLETICLKAMAKEADRRYPTAAELAADLRRFLKGEPIHARPVGRLGRAWRWCRRNPLVASLTAAVAFLLLASTVIATVMAIRIDAARSEAEGNRTSAEINATAARDSASRAEQARAELAALLVKEQKARQDADQARRKAQELKLEAESALYFDRLGSAARHWADNDLEQAERRLDECPSDLHQWEWHYLKRLCHAELDTVPGPGSAAGYPAAISPDGRLAASVTTSFKGGQLRLRAWGIKVWDVATGKELHELSDSPGVSLHGLAFSPDSKRLATAGGDGVVRVWNVEEERLLHMSGGRHKKEVLAVAFSPGGEYLASGGADSIAKVWDATTGKELMALPGHLGGAHAVAFSPDGRTLLTGADDAVRAWEVSGLRRDRPTPGAPPVRELYGGTIHALACSPDGKLLAAAGHSGFVMLSDLETASNRLTVGGHGPRVNALAFSSDGSLAAAEDDRTIRVWRAVEGRELFVLRGHRRAVRAVAYGPDDRLFSIGDDETLRVWDGRTGGQGLRLAGMPGGLAFSPDSRRLATISPRERTGVTVWDLASGQPTVTLPLQKAAGELRRLGFGEGGKSLFAFTQQLDEKKDRVLRVRGWDLATRTPLAEPRLADRSSVWVGSAPGQEPHVLFSPDGALTAEPGLRTVTIHEVATGKQRHVLTGGIEALEAAAFSGDGRYLAAAGRSRRGTPPADDYVAEVWDVATGRLLASCPGRGGEIHGLALHHGADGDLLALAGADQTVRVWEVRPGRDASSPAPGRLRFTLRGHTQPVRGAAFSPDGQRLASVSRGTSGGETKLWDVRTGHELLTLGPAGEEVAFSPNGSFLAVADGEDVVRVWDGTPTRELLTCREAGPSVAFSPDGQLLLTAGQSEAVKLREANTGREVRAFVGSGPPPRRAVFSPDGRLVASAGEDGTLRLWDAGDGRLLHALTGHQDAVFDLAFSPDGRRLASAGADEMVRLWDVAGGREVRAFPNHGDRVLCVAFHPDGKRLASGGDDRMVRIWEADTGRELFRFEHQGFVHGVAFSPDGRLLASAGEDRLIKLWDPDAGREVRTLTGHADGVRGVVFSPDGKRLASAGWDKKVKVWDAATGKELLSLPGHTEGVLGVDFARDGWRLASSGADGTVRVWDTRRG